MAVKLQITNEQLQELKSKILEHKAKPGPLMPTLHDAQRIFGCVPLEIQKIISEELGVSISTINGVVTFYAHFSLEPKGKHVIGVCLGTACYVRGSQSIVDKFKEILKIEAGQTTEDGLFTLQETRCVGACGLAPVFQIGEEVYGNATVKTATDILGKIK
jgi:NADH:ubiquinone oxidoreductase subunit E